jgi:hypothetical protein
VDYWTQKFKLNQALIDEKEATIRRLEYELMGLRKRKERIGKKWVESRKKGRLVEDADDTDTE